MWLYGVKRTAKNGEHPKTWPELQRIRDCGDLSFWDDDHNGERVTICTLTEWMTANGAPRRDLFKAPVETQDGLLYYAAKQLPTLQELRKDIDTVRDYIEVRLACGVDVEIVPASLSPRALMFSPTGPATIGDAISRYGALSDELLELALRITELQRQIKGGQTCLQGDLDELIEQDNAKSPQLLILALQQAYNLTHESLNEQLIISHKTDMSNVITAAWGIDPKKDLVPAAEDGG